MPEFEQLSGTVVETRLGMGSKSDRLGVILHTDHGDFTLRRIGANAFDDPALTALIGKFVTVEGLVADNTVFLKTDPVVR